jgi:hypothetical protein
MLFTSLRGRPTPIFFDAKVTGIERTCKLWRKRWESNRTLSFTTASSALKRWLSSLAQQTFTLPLIAIRHRLFRGRLPMLSAQARRLSQLHIGTQLSCKTTVAARLSRSRIRAPSRKRQLNLWIRQLHATLCVNALICSRGKWPGRGWRRVV